MSILTYGSKFYIVSVHVGSGDCLRGIRTELIKVPVDTSNNQIITSFLNKINIENKYNLKLILDYNNCYHDTPINIFNLTNEKDIQKIITELSLFLTNLEIYKTHVSITEVKI
jgi:hypothetical protein